MRFSTSTRSFSNKALAVAFVALMPLGGLAHAQDSAGGVSQGGHSSNESSSSGPGGMSSKNLWWLDD